MKDEINNHTQNTDFTTNSIESTKWIDNKGRNQPFLPVHKRSLRFIDKIQERNAKIKNADDSIRLFDDWCATNDQKLMKDIISYNKEDCVSTCDLRKFLLKHKPDNIPDFSQSDEEKDMNSEFKDFEKKEIDLKNFLFYPHCKKF